MFKNHRGMKMAGAVVILGTLTAVALGAMRPEWEGTRASSNPVQVVAAANTEQRATSAPPAPVHVGTILPGESDIEATLSTVRVFARQQQDTISGVAGWLRLRSVLSIPASLQGNGYHVAEADSILPMSTLTPQDAVFESWYRLDKAGAIVEGMGLVLSQDGTIHQQTILLNGKWINLTLKRAGAYRQQYETVATHELIRLLPNVIALTALEERLTWKGVAIQSISENGRLEIVIEQTLDAPIDNAIGVIEPIVKTRELFRFDAATGNLVMRIAQYQTSDGAWLTSESETYTPPELLPELPENVQQMKDEALRLLP